MLYTILSILTFIGSISWAPVKNDSPLEISQYVMSSPLLQDYGESNLIKSFINLNSNIFSGGCEVLIPKGFEIVKVPENLKLVNSPIHMKNNIRYTALYKQGKLKDEYNEMKRKVYSKLGISDLNNITNKSIESISQKSPKLAIGNRAENQKMQISAVPPENKGDIKHYPTFNEHKAYISFIVIEKDRNYKVLPVILILDPMQKIENYISKLNEGGKR